MADERTWQYEMTRERVPELQHKLEWALQHQNRQFNAAVDRIAYDSSVAQTMHRMVPTILRVLGGLGLALLAVIVVGNPAGARREAVVLIPMGLLFAAVIGIAPHAPRIRMRLRGLRPSKQFAGRLLARQADTTYRRVAARAPYTIDYRLAGDVLEARAPAIRVVRRLELRRARRVLDGGTVLFVFRRPASVSPYRYIYVATADDHDAVVAAFTRAGATVETLTGPLDGYVAPVPEARVHST